MTDFVSAMDVSANYTFTENGQLSFTTKGVNSNILALYFKLVRGADEDYILELVRKINSDPSLLEDIMVLTFQTRDIRGGKGERQLFYILFLYLYATNTREFMKSFLALIPEYGSFKDLNILWEMASTKTSPLPYSRTNCDNLKSDIIELYTFHLRKDILTTADTTLSLAGKWAPRESGHFRDMARALANNYLKDQQCSQKKVYTIYRKMVSGLNKRLNTTEINMAGKTWQDISPEKVPSKCLLINRDAFQNKIHSGTKEGEQRSREEDRIVCAEKFKKHLESGKEVHGGVLHPNDIIKRYTNDSVDLVLEAQWTDIVAEYKKIFSEKLQNGETIRNTIPIIDVSGSMTGYYAGSCAPIDAAVGLGILLSELTNGPFKNRAITFSESPEWINFYDSDTLVQKIKRTKIASWGMNTNLYKTFEMILNIAVITDIQEKEICNMDLIILSDMQFDSSQKHLGHWQTTLENIKQMYSESGYNSIPHIVFWNLQGGTMDFPEQANTPNVTMVSGFSPSAAQTLLTEGVDTVKKEKKTPEDTLREILDDERYLPVRRAFRPSFYTE